MNHPVTVGGGHFNNAGILDVGTSAQSVTGNYTQAAGGAYRIGLSDTSSHYGKLVVSGNVSLSSGTTVDVRISGSPIIAGGTVVQGVITAGGSLTANPDSVVVTDNSRLYDFVASTARNGKQLDLIAIANPQAFAAAGGPDHPVTAGAATELQNLLNSGAPGMAAVFGKLDLMSAAQIPGAVQQMLPAVQGAVAQAGVSALHSMNKVIQSRIESNTGLSSGDAVPDNFLWGRVFGNEGRQEDIDGVSGFHSDTSGLVIGGDAPVTPKVRAGGAFTYASSRIKGNSDAAPSHVDVDTFEVVGYASYNIDPRTDINYQLDVGRNQARSHRDILFMGSAAQASFSSLSVHGSAGIGRLVPLSERTNITPSMRLDYTRMRTGAYQETGADALDLAVRAQVYREFLATGDVKFAHHLGDRLKLVGNGSAGYDFINQHTQTTSTFSGGGAAFVTNGLAVSPWVYRAGLGLVKDGSKGVEYSLRYDAEARTSGYLNQTLSAKVRWAL
jgi:outer membrane autotransporter protein